LQQYPHDNYDYRQSLLDGWFTFDEEGGKQQQAQRLGHSSHGFSIITLLTHLEVKLSSWLITKAPCHEGVWQTRGSGPPSLTSALQSSAECPTLLPLYLRGNDSRYQLDWRLKGPRAGFDVVEKEKSLATPGNDQNKQTNKQTNSVALSPRANYTD
jgi:hypothetical protein